MKRTKVVFINISTVKLGGDYDLGLLRVLEDIMFAVKTHVNRPHLLSVG